MNVALEMDEDRAWLVVEDPSPAALLGNGRAEFRIQACPSPLCDCRDMRFVERAGDGSSADSRPRQFVLDPFRRCPAEPDPSAAPESERLARQVAEAMSAESWKRLVGMFMNVKARAIAGIDCERERASFPFDEIERDGVMVSYRETIPFDREIVVTDGARELLVDELHCVLPDCDCSDAILFVHEIDHAVGPDGAGSATEVAALLVDHRRGRWVEADTDGPLGDEAVELRRLLLAQHPQILATLGRQQALLRDLYRTAAADAARPVHAPPTPLVAGPRIGRNDPALAAAARSTRSAVWRHESPEPDADGPSDLATSPP